MTEGFKSNPGWQPEETKGKRLRVVLRNGRQPVSDWPADSTRWRLIGDDFDIMEYRIV